MSAYPPNAGYWETPLPDMLIRQQERLEEAEIQAVAADRMRERFDEGIVGMEWALTQVSDLFSIPVIDVMQMLGDITRYANTGLRADWLAKALEEVR